MTALTDLRAEIATLVVHTEAEKAERLQVLVAHVVEDMTQLIVEYAAALLAVRDAEKAWTFDSDQVHTHTWHDREDWKDRNDSAVAAARARYP